MGFVSLWKTWWAFFLVGLDPPGVGGGAAAAQLRVARAPGPARLSAGPAAAPELACAPGRARRVPGSAPDASGRLPQPGAPAAGPHSPGSAPARARSAHGAAGPRAPGRTDAPGTARGSRGPRPGSEAEGRQVPPLLSLPLPAAALPCCPFSAGRSAASPPSGPPGLAPPIRVASRLPSPGSLSPVRLPGKVAFPSLHKSSPSLRRAGWRRGVRENAVRPRGWRVGAAVPRAAGSHGWPRAPWLSPGPQEPALGTKPGRGVHSSGGSLLVLRKRQVCGKARSGEARRTAVPPVAASAPTSGWAAACLYYRPANPSCVKIRGSGASRASCRGERRAPRVSQSPCPAGPPIPFAAASLSGRSTAAAGTRVREVFPAVQTGWGAPQLWYGSPAALGERPLSPRPVLPSCCL